jgi:peptidoglycan/LPS O-acetylase OafA/YrhL
MTQKQDNIRSIQMLRGIAATMVVLVHSVGVDYLPAGNIFREASSYGWMGVEIFFIISGFIIPYSMFRNRYHPTEFGSLMMRRIIRIEPPYLISIALILTLNYAVFLLPWNRGLHTPPLDWSNLLGHIGYINAFTHKPWLCSVYWTLAIEFEFYIIMGVFFTLITHANRAVRLVTHFGLLATTFITPYLHISEFRNVHSDHIFWFFPFFLVGIATFLYRCQVIRRPEFLLMVAVDMAICFKDHGGILVTISIGALLAILYIKRVPSLLLWLGTISYSLYLIHPLVIDRVVTLMGHFTHGRYMGFTMFITVLVCILAAYLYYLVVEKPFLELAKRYKAYNKAKVKTEVATIAVEEPVG